MKQISDFILPAGVREDRVAADPLPDAQPKEVKLQERTADYVLFTHGVFYLWLPRIDPIMDLVARRPEIEILRQPSTLPFFDFEHPKNASADYRQRLQRWNHSICLVQRQHWPLIKAHMEASILAQNSIPLCSTVTIETSVPDCGLLVASAVLPKVSRVPAYVFGVESGSHHTVVTEGQEWRPTVVAFPPKPRGSNGGGKDSNEGNHPAVPAA